jgi:ADP-ribose pyrophosphatase YjhB (NUDIX family)
MDEEKGYSLIADVALFKDRSVLFVKYKDSDAYDGQTGWFLPDASIKYLEHPDKAANRLLHEQVGLDKVSPKLDHIESFRGNDAFWHLSFHYRSEIGKLDLTPGEDVAEAKWFPLDALPAKDKVAHHGWALTTLRKMLT